MLELRYSPVDILTWEIAVNSKIVGHISWRESKEWLSRGHISYEVAEQYRCKGYAQGALKMVLEYIYRVFPEYEKVQICCAVDNVASRCVVERCGGERDLSRGEIFQDPTDGRWTVSYWVPVKKVVDEAEEKV